MIQPKTCKALIALAVFLMSSAISASSQLPLNQAEKDWLKIVQAIITPGEKTAFKKNHHTHMDRLTFIEAFWLKRDPNLATEANEFKDNYLTRYQEVQEDRVAYDNGHFNAFTMEDLYLLLGEPDRRYLGLDHRIMGYHSDYRKYTRTLRRSPEVWEYKNPGYGYPNRTLVVQFIATSSKGDYVALCDTATDRFFDNLKQKFIVNPQSEVTSNPSVHNAE